MLRLEISEKEIEEYVALRLRSVGFDLSKEIKCHAKIEREGDAITRVYTQESDAPLTNEAQEQQTAAQDEAETQSKRPEWLKGKTS